MEDFFEEEGIDSETLENEIFLVDILNIQSFKYADIYFQCSQADLTEKIRRILIESEFAWGLKINLTPEHKLILLSELATYQIHMYFASVELRLINRKLFEVFDGCEFAIFSKTLEIPKWFVEKYQNRDRYVISNEW